MRDDYLPSSGMVHRGSRSQRIPRREGTPENVADSRVIR